MCMCMWESEAESKKSERARGCEEGKENLWLHAKLGTDLFLHRVSKIQKSSLKSCQCFLSVPACAWMSQRENTNTNTHVKIKNLTLNHSVNLFHSAKKMPTKIKNCRSSINKKRLHACLQKVTKQKQRTNLHRISSKQLLTAATLKANSKAAWNSKINYSTVS